MNDILLAAWAVLWITIAIGAILFVTRRKNDVLTPDGWEEIVPRSKLKPPSYREGITYDETP